MKKMGFLILAILTLSCNSDDLSIDSEYSEIITGKSINTDINFMPEEKFSSNDSEEPQLKLKLITTEIFPCINFGISTTQFNNGNELIIRFNEIIIYDICATALGPAISYISLPEDTKALTLINGKVIDKYAVEIDGEKISIRLIQNNFTSSLHDETFRFPENSFAYVSGTNTNNTNIHAEFLALLRDNPHFTEFEFEGEGRIPYPERSNGYWVNHPSKFFKYSNVEEFEKLAGVLNSFSSEFIEENSGVSIAIYGWNNTYYHSWGNN